ncbi:Transcriptional regulator, TetR family [Acidisarcina polymorpha]|uniref:Transcriptional regulator, TetR family n=1 Tax=Acidisarcina polymorpha TaxID=2211140 RepID=A0A2Z5G6E0_9BACT|nr:TetR/AcrR family transcriptional regulator [Acidisarcina polymorpha]AXC14116.1 Transcriptional regulator, TetR family [Acidisarcina polymorpha]
MDQEITIDVSGVSGQRGPADHKRRQQILQAADEHFRLYGYRKTTLADIAKAINLSTPYLYKFFDSKQAIGEAICSHCLGTILTEVEQSIAATRSPVEKMRRVFIGLESRGWRLLNEQRKMHDLVSASFEEGWGSLDRFKEAVFQIIRRIVVQGRESGEFERKTPLEETCRTIARMTELFFHPTLLEQAGKSQEEEAVAAANVVIRSLTA